MKNKVHRHEPCHHSSPTLSQHCLWTIDDLTDLNLLPSSATKPPVVHVRLSGPLICLSALRPADEL